MYNNTKTTYHNVIKYINIYYDINIIREVMKYTQ